jgi:hypothetical protein
MCRKLNPWFLFIVLEVSKAAPQAIAINTPKALDTATLQAPGEGAPQSLIINAPMPHIPGTASNAIKTINNFIESIQNRERPHDEDSGAKFGSYHQDFSKSQNFKSKKRIKM